MVKKNIFRSVLFKIVLSILSGCLMFLAWPNNGFAFLIFIGLVPLFFAIDQISVQSKLAKGFLIWLVFFIAHFLWLGASSYWVSESSVKTYLVAITIESLIFSIPFISLLWLEKVNKTISWVFIITLWMTLEFLNQNWYLGTPYFLLGSGLGMTPYLIQNYEFIGIEGGSLFILISNVSVFLIIKKITIKVSYKKNVVFLLIGLFPFVTSLFVTGSDANENKSSNDQIDVSILHTYTEAYTEENHAHPEKMIAKLWLETTKNGKPTSELIIWPETIVSNMGWLSNQENEVAYNSFIQLFDSTSNFSLCAGGYAFSITENGQKDPYAQFEANRKFYYSSHNVAMTYNFAGLPDVRSKEIFVPFQERIPYLNELPFLKNLADVVGANTRISYYEKSKDVHKTKKNHKFTPILCFESIFPSKMAKKAEEIDFFVILANEYWNPQIEGSKQYLYNNVGIAIQSRIPIFRSSNSGVSGLVNKYGEIMNIKIGNDIGLINCSAIGKTDITFYESINGLFYYLNLIVSFGILAFAFIKSRIKSN